MNFELCESRNLLSGASIAGVKFDTVNSSGFSPGDVPLAGVFIDLYKDNGDAVFNPGTDTLADRQQTAVGTGAYTFANVADGHYFVKEEVPTGYTQSAGPAYYTLDVIGGAVFSSNTENIDTFADPNPATTYFISAINANPFFHQDSGPGIIGGQRDLLVKVLGPANPISATGFVGTIGTNAGVFNLGSAASGPGTTVTMQYDGVDVDTAALHNAMGLSADLTANGNNGIRFDFNFLQVGTGTTMDMTAAATSPGGSTASFSSLITANGSAFSVFVPFSSFSTTGTFTFANVSSLQFSFNQSGVQNADFELAQIVAAQQSNTGFNFGNFPTISSLAGHVYVDSNNNGIIDLGEPPIGGVIVTLTGTNDLGQPVIQTTTTAANGTYSFNNLRPGTYKLSETQPINFIDGKDTIGTPGGITTNDMFSNIVLPGGFNGVNNNFGELGLTPTYSSKRSLLSPPPPVVLTAVYAPTTTDTTANLAASTAPTVHNSSKVTTTTTNTTTISAKPAVVMTTPSTYKVPLASTAKKTTTYH